MSIKLTSPQSVLLGELFQAGGKGVFKATANSSAASLVTMGYGRWDRKYNNGRDGTLVITEKGRAFKEGRL